LHGIIFLGNAIESLTGQGNQTLQTSCPSGYALLWQKEKAIDPWNREASSGAML
jgi:hypothetical protein